MNKGILCVEFMLLKEWVPLMFQKKNILLRVASLEALLLKARGSELKGRGTALAPSRVGQPRDGFYAKANLSH